MKLSTQKRLAADILKCSSKRILFDEDSLESISEAITKQDIKGLINDGAIIKRPARGISRVRANKRIVQRRKGRQQGPGKRKGTRNSRAPKKEVWMNKIRSQRIHLRKLRDDKEIEQVSYRNLYRKASGGYFRSKRHINQFIDEQKMRKQ